MTDAHGGHDAARSDERDRGLQRLIVQRSADGTFADCETFGLPDPGCDYFVEHHFLYSPKG